MVDPELYIKEGLKIVKTLISQGNFQAALKGCQELLKVNPYHRKVQKYLQKIEEAIIEKNFEKVDADIEATMHLWKEERFDDLLRIYTRLYQYAPQHEKLKKLIVKLHEKLSHQQKNERNDFIQKALIAIDQLVKEAKYGDAIQASNELLSLDPLNRTAERYLAKAREQLVEKKLVENARLIDSSDFERSLEFFDTLLAIDPNSAKVKKMALRARAHLAEQKLLAGKIHLNESIARMKELFSQSEYEKVIQACEEIDRLEPGNLTAKIFRKKAKRTMEAEIDELATKKLKETWKEMAPSYAKNPESFVEI